jgi:biuret amidohydrolase
MRRWRNRQTRKLEGLVSARTWGFKSPPSHHERRTLKMRTALIVIDCQNDFMAGASAYECAMLDRDLIVRISKLIAYARKREFPIFYTQHSILPDKSNAENLEPDTVRTCIEGTTGCEIISDLRPISSDTIIRKDKWSAFDDTKLDEILKKRKLMTLVLCGVLTNNCVRATAESAYQKGYKVIIVSDCCGATSYIPNTIHPRYLHWVTLLDLDGRTYDSLKLSTLDKLHKVV